MKIGGKSCPLCQLKFNESEAAYVCAECGVPHHIGCWEKNGGCKTVNCKGYPLNSQLAPEPTLRIAEDRSVFCPKCGMENSRINRLCTKCGISLIDTMDLSQNNNRKYKNKPLTSTSSETIASNRESTIIDKMATSTNSQSINPSLSWPQAMISGKSMKWYNLFIKYMIPIWLILGSLVYVSNINTSVYQYYDGSFERFFTDERTGIINIIDLVMQIATIIILIMAISPLKSYQKSGYSLITSYFIIRMIYPFVVYLFFVDYIDLAVLAGQNLFNIVFCVLNLIYFAKRKHIISNH